MTIRLSGTHPPRPSASDHPPLQDVLATGLAFPEGPVALPDGSVAVVQMAADLVTVLSPGGTRCDLDCPGGPNGMALDDDGQHAVVCLNGGLSFTRTADDRLLPGRATDADARGGIARISLTTGALRPLVPRGPSSPLSGPNDLVRSPTHSPAGPGWWVTDLGRQLADRTEPGCVAFVHDDGSLVVAAPGRTGRPNGVGLSPDARTLYVSESRTARLWAWPVRGPGLLGEPRLVHAFPPPCRLDGLAITRTGNVVVATLVAGRLTTVSPEGRVIGVDEVDDPMPTNACFSGLDGRDLLVTLGSTGRVVRRHWHEPGALP